MASESSFVATVAVVIQVVSCLAIVANILVLSVFVSTPSLRRQHYVFVLSLALADTIGPVAAFVLQVHFIPGPLAVFRSANFAAELSILAIAVHRLHVLGVLASPSRYDATATSRARLLAACLLIWLVSAVVFTPATLIQTHALYLFRPLLFLAVLLLTSLLYLAAFRKIVAHQATLSGVNIAADDQQTVKCLAQSRRLVVSFAIILIISAISLLPFCLCNILVYASGERITEQTPSFLAVYKMSTACLLARSIVNPFMYWWHLGDFRRSLTSRLSCRPCRNHGNDTSVSMTVNSEILMR